MKRAVIGLTTLVTGLALVPPASAQTTAMVPAAVNLSTVSYGIGSLATQVNSSLASFRSGPTAYTTIACTTQPGLTRSNRLVSTSIPALRTGVTTTGARSLATSTSRTAEGTTAVAGLDLLGGAITASAITTRTTSTVTSAGTATGTNASSLVGLKINGKGINASVPPNTTLSISVGGLPLGKVVINEQRKAVVDGLVRGYTRALSVTITSPNRFALPIGTEIVVGQSAAFLGSSARGYTAGEGYGAKATLLNGAVKSGPVSFRPVPCITGTGQANVASAGLPNLVSTGVVDTKTSSVSGSTLKSSVTNTVAGASLLNLISATAVKAETSTTRPTRTSPVTTTDTSRFVGLRIAGLPAINDSVKPNTTLKLPGIGTVTLHRVVKSPKGIRVTMVHVVLANALGVLPTGSVIEIGVSETRVN